MHVYVNKTITFGNLHEISKCDVATTMTADGTHINNSMIDSGDLIFDSEGSCGIVRSIINDIFSILVVSKINKCNKSNINSTINRI